MNVSSVLKKPEANYFFSFVIGLGLAVLMFHRPQTEVEVSAISPSKIREMVTRVDGQCYRFHVEDASCPASGVSL
jgi:hypothetical protein